MKLHKLIFSALVLSAAVSACYQPDELVREDNENVMNLSVKATLVQNGVDYDAVIDEENGEIVFEMPYYISDTEEIMSDLTEVKIRATMPLGAKFNPGLSGIHDFSEGKVFTTTLLYEDGTSVPYLFRAEREKSSASTITAVSLADESVRVAFNVTPPTEDNPKGKLTVLKTSASVEAALQQVKISVSPWASMVAYGYDDQTGYLNLNNISEIKIISQNGVDYTVYEVSIETPELVPSGRVGYVSSLFGVQCTAANTLGFEADANCSIAAVDNYLIVSNKNDFNRMAVLNRFSGRQVTDVTINTSGIDAGRQLRAIGTDDDGNLVAATYTCTKAPTETTIANGWDYLLTDPAIKIYVWLDGLQSAPTCVMDLDIKSAQMNALPSKASELFNLLGVKGSFRSGNAVVTSTDASVARVFAFFFENGTFKKVEQYCPLSGGKAFWLSTKNASKADPLSTSSPLTFVLNGDFRPQVAFYDGTTGGSCVFDQPTSHWWVSNGNYDYTKSLRGCAGAFFNGTYIIAVANGTLSNGIWSHRLYFSNIGAAPSASSFKDGFLFDSREGNLEYGDESNGGPAGTGFKASGMTSTYPFVSSEGTFGGDNATRRGDVICVESSDGNSLQFYMFTCNAGILGYEITRYDM